MTLSHDLTGDGPSVLVLLHSGVCDRRMWDGQVPALAAAGFRVLRCDFRGFGSTPAAEAPYSDAADVLELLDHLGIGRAAFVASSYGGEVALDIAAAARPGAVSALVLLCAGTPELEPGPAIRAFAEQEDALLEAGDLAAATELNVRTWCGPEADDAAREAVRTMQANAFAVQWAAEQAGFEFSSDGPEESLDYAGIGVPVLAVSGAHDLPEFRDVAAELGRVVPGARHVELDWAGHLPSLERPEETTRLLLDFLVAAEAGAGPETSPEAEATA